MITIKRKITIQVRLAGTSAQYYVLRVFNQAGEVVHCHTSKSRYYLQKIAERY